VARWPDGREIGRRIPPTAEKGRWGRCYWLAAFRDGKTGFPIVLVQCTIQADLVSKSLDIDVRNWSSWLELVHDPSTILTAPQVVPGNTEIWNELALKNLVFDRLRLVELLDRNFSSSLQEEMSAWLLAVVQKVRVRIEST